MSISYQSELFQAEALIDQQERIESRSGTFLDNMKLPIHRWFRYSAGFSADWVRSILREKPSVNMVLDPFAGSATTLLAGNAEHVNTMGFEMHPFIYRIAEIKVKALNADVRLLTKRFNDFYKRFSEFPTEPPDSLPALLYKCYADQDLAKLAAMKNLFQAEYDDSSLESEILWLCITSILRKTSNVGTAQWQYILPNKKKNNSADPAIAFKEKAAQILSDIQYAKQNGWVNASTILNTDARQPKVDEADFVDLVVTSPPYPNNYDYADATRLELSFWGEVEGWKDLQSKVRQYLIRSCSQHSAAEKLDMDQLLQSKNLQPIHKELSEACEQLAEIRLKKGGRKTYHTMAAAYFSDLAQVFISLRKLCRDNSRVCFVIGDSAPYGIYLNVDKWLGELAMAAGFIDYKFEKIRDRNIKWKNRKHRVPLKEGRLLIKG